MSVLAVSVKLRETGMTRGGQARNSRLWMLQQETSDGRWLSDGMAGRAADDDDDGAGLI